MIVCGLILLETAISKFADSTNFWLGGWRSSSEVIMWDEGCRGKFSKLSPSGSIDPEQKLTLDIKSGQWIVKNGNKLFPFVCEVEILLSAFRCGT